MAEHLEELKRELDQESNIEDSYDDEVFVESFDDHVCGPCLRQLPVNNFVDLLAAWNAY